MKRYPRCIAVLILVGALAGRVFAAAGWIGTQSERGSFPLVSDAHAATFVVSPADFKVVDIAAGDLANDVERVTGLRPASMATPFREGGPLVLIGTLGRHPLIDQLVASKQLDVRDLAGSWESFVIATLANPFPNVPAALVIVGSDRRGTAFGIYELSQAIGVSPWYWWADVTPEKKPALFVAAGMRRFGPPSVKYRGIFLNDEDWGLQPWAAKTFEPENGNLGPKTYAKLFELMLRLKANTVWPAMHACTKPFNFFPQNAPLADDYAIVMGSSHAEPMLRNNVGEWTAPPETYNYITNRDGVLKYWDERLAANGRFENIYTLGMRGIHDSNMQGPKTDAERINALERIFADQRALLAKHVRPEVERVPQMFCAYKEVLSLYRQGLKVPDDVTIVWPDDNHGYIRNYANAGERKRSGGFGVYYHLSYLGAPMSYLWLSTTPPALIWAEMRKAYDLGARTIWIANVGDLKPAEIGTEFFLQMAWDVDRWNRENLPNFLPEWAAREFGSEHAKTIAWLMRDYYALNYQRRPEHLQWWMPQKPPQPSPLTRAEIEQRRAAWNKVRPTAKALWEVMSEEKRDAFYELVAYPVWGSALANERYFCGELATVPTGDSAAAEKLAARASAADAELKEITRVFNEETAGGKWRGFLSLEPADNNWRSMRIAPWAPPAFSRTPTPAPAPPSDSTGFIALEAERFTRKTDRGGATWEIIPGLGRTGDSVAMFPNTAPSVATDRLAADAPRLEYDVDFPAAGEFAVTVNLIPTHPLAGGELRFAIALDGAPPQLVSLEVRDGGAEWAQGVLNATRVAAAKLNVPTAGAHTLRVFGVDAGVVLDKIVIDCGGLTASYLGPRDTRPTRTFSSP